MGHRRALQRDIERMHLVREDITQYVEALAAELDAVAGGSPGVEPHTRG